MSISDGWETVTDPNEFEFEENGLIEVWYHWKKVGGRVLYHLSRANEGER